MKTIYIKILLCASFLIPLEMLGVIHTVEVSEFQFSPASLNVSVGDTIQWVWINGSHTTTSRTIPTGAPAWDELIRQSNPVYMYPVTMSGTYNYVCDPHESMGMVGQFTAVNTSGINELKGVSALDVFLDKESSSLNVNYVLSEGTDVTLHVCDLTGKSVLTTAQQYKPAGEYHEIFALSELRQGIYFIELLSGNSRMTKKIMID